MRVSQVGFNHPKLTLSMHVFGPRIQTDTHTYIYIYISCESRLNTPVWGSLRSPNYCKYKEVSVNDEEEGSTALLDVTGIKTKLVTEFSRKLL